MKDAIFHLSFGLFMRVLKGIPGTIFESMGGTSPLFQKGPNNRIQRNFIVVPCDQHVILNPDNTG